MSQLNELGRPYKQMDQEVKQTRWAELADGSSKLGELDELDNT